MGKLSFKSSSNKQTCYLLKHGVWKDHFEVQTNVTVVYCGLKIKIKGSMGLDTNSLYLIMW